MRREMAGQDVGIYEPDPDETDPDEINPSEFEFEEDTHPDSLRPGTARHVLRYLSRHGWLQPRPTAEGQTNITIPHYAYALLTTFNRLTGHREVSSPGALLSISDLLSQAARDCRERSRANHSKGTAANGTRADDRTWEIIRERIAEAARQMQSYVGHLQL
jgi:hypothetical protein